MYINLYNFIFSSVDFFFLFSIRCIKISLSDSIMQYFYSQPAITFKDPNWLLTNFISSYQQVNISDQDLSKIHILLTLYFILYFNLNFLISQFKNCQQYNFFNFSILWCISPTGVVTLTCSLQQKVKCTVSWK